MNAPLEVLCALCGKPIEGEGVQKFNRGQPCVLHPACWSLVEADRAKTDQRRIAEAQATIRRDFEYSAKKRASEQPTGGLPDFPFARVDNQEFLARGSKRIIRALQNYQFNMPLMVSAATGGAKTAAVVARLEKEKSDLIAAATPQWPSSCPPGFRPRFFFVAGYELALARRNWKLGAESPIITEAKDIEFLVMDEVGFEPLTEIPFEILDHRYRAHRATVITTGLKPAEFRARYGDAAFRRIAEGGAVIEDW